MPVSRKSTSTQNFKRDVCLIDTSDSTAIYPDLLEADAEQIVVGLESGFWTSVDLTKVNLILEDFGIGKY